MSKKSQPKGQTDGIRLAPMSDEWIVVCAGDRGVWGLTLPRRTREDAVKSATDLFTRRYGSGPDEQLARQLLSEGEVFVMERGGSHSDQRNVKDVVDRAEDQLRRYYAGELKEFDLPLDLSLATDFQAAILRAASKIRYGDTVSYGELAALSGHAGAARAVGGAMARNPLAPVVPCHRVIGANGDLHGFSSGLDLKRRLLEMEKIAHIKAH